MIIAVDGRWGVYHTLSRREIDIEFWLENLKGRHLLGVLVVDGRKQNALECKGIYYVILDWVNVA